MGVFSFAEKFWSPKSTVAVTGSLVYSSVFPFTVAVGESRGYSSASSYMDLSFVMAWMSASISSSSPSLQIVYQWSSLLAIVNAEWYLPALLYVTVFEATSHTAHASFNFEEVSLISHAITHTLFYVMESPFEALAPHELFLPALTLGMLVAIAPAVPVLRRIRTAEEPMILADVSYGIVGMAILLCVRPWLAAGLGGDPFLWVVNYMTASQGYEIRLAIAVWWITI